MQATLLHSLQTIGAHFLSDLLVPCKLPPWGAVVEFKEHQTVDLSRVIGTCEYLDEAATWGDLLGGPKDEAPQRLKRLDECVKHLEWNPDYYVDSRGKDDWTFIKVGSDYFIEHGIHRTVVGRCYLDLTRQPAFVHGVNVQTVDPLEWARWQEQHGYLAAIVERSRMRPAADTGAFDDLVFADSVSDEPSPRGQSSAVAKLLKATLGPFGVIEIDGSAESLAGQGATLPPTLAFLDPECIGPSSFANRLAYNWQTKSFQELKQSIGQAGGNEQPVIVRPAAAGAPAMYEIVTGHRRHRACADLGLKVKAVIEVTSDRDLVVRMSNENGKRKDLSPYERGCEMKRALDAGLFENQVQLSAVLDVDPSTLGKWLRLAELPSEVVEAFRSPAVININWGAALHEALDKDRSGVIERAVAIRTSGHSGDPNVVFDRLVGKPLVNSAGSEPTQIVVKVGRKRFAVISVPPPSDSQGVTVQFARGAIEPDVLRGVLEQMAAQVGGGKDQTQSTTGRHGLLPVSRTPC